METYSRLEQSKIDILPWVDTDGTNWYNTGIPIKNIKLLDTKLQFKTQFDWNFAYGGWGQQSMSLSLRTKTDTTGTRTGDIAHSGRAAATYQNFLPTVGGVQDSEYWSFKTGVTYHIEHKPEQLRIWDSQNNNRDMRFAYPAPASSNPNSASLLIFASSSARQETPYSWSGYGKIRFLEMRIYGANAVMLAWYIPAREILTGKIGIYDLVNERFIIPEGNPLTTHASQYYRLLPYLELTGTQYIDTGIGAETSTKCEIKFRCNNISDNNGFVFGAGGSAWNDNAYELYPWSSKWQFNIGTNTDDDGKQWLGPASTNDTIFRYDQSSASITSEGVTTKVSYSGRTKTNVQRLYLGALNRTSGVSISPSVLRIYYMKIWYTYHSRYMLPCIRIDGNNIVYGLFDCAYNGFYIVKNSSGQNTTATIPSGNYQQNNILANKTNSNGWQDGTCVLGKLTGNFEVSWQFKANENIFLGLMTDAQLKSVEQERSTTPYNSFTSSLYNYKDGNAIYFWEGSTASTAHTSTTAALSINQTNIYKMIRRGSELSFYVNDIPLKTSDLNIKTKNIGTSDYNLVCILYNYTTNQKMLSQITIKSNIEETSSYTIKGAGGNVLTPVEYLIFTGSQYINTLIPMCGLPKDTIDLKFLPNVNGGQNQAIIGARATDNAAYLDNNVLFYNVGGNKKLRCDWSAGDANLSIDNPYSPINIYMQRGRCVLNGKEYLDSNLSSAYIGKNFTIGTLNQPNGVYSNKFNGRLYGLYLRKNGKFKHNNIMYQMLQYISNNGSAYLNTGYYLSTSSAWEISFQLNNTNVGKQIAGTYGGIVSQITTYNLPANNNVNSLCIQHMNSDSLTGLGYINTDTNRHTVYMKSGVQRIDNATKASSTVSNSATAPLYIGTRGGTSSISPANVKIYYCKIWDGNTLVRDLIPVKRLSDNVTGMFDQITKTFYGSEVSSTFSPGDVIANEDHYYLPMKYNNNGTITYGLCDVGNGRNCYFPTGGTVSGGPERAWHQYQQLDYIESIGDQYIDTGYIDTPNTKVSIDIQFYDLNPTQQRLFGHGWDSDGTNYVSFEAYINGNSQWARATKDGQGNWQASGIAADTKRHTFVLDNNYFKIYTNGSLIYDGENSSTITRSNQVSLYLLGRNRSDNYWYANARLYGCIIYEKGIPVRKYTPVRNLFTGKCGMYEWYENKFYTGSNTSGSSFIGGPVTYPERLFS